MSSFSFIVDTNIMFREPMYNIVVNTCWQA